jgi:hypothetical protein
MECDCLGSFYIAKMPMSKNDLNLLLHDCTSIISLRNDQAHYFTLKLATWAAIDFSIEN